MTIYGYVYVATERQAKGLSLDEQERRITDHALDQGRQLTEVFVERGISSSVALGERPEGRRMLDKLAAGDILIVPKLGCMFSGSLDALTVIRDFHERKISLWLLDLGGYVSGNDVIEPMLKILSSILECERGHRSERIREAKEQQRRKGKFLGGAPPFGWTRNPAAPDELLLVDAEQTAITEMREMRGTGCSLRDIAEEMRARGFQLSHEGVKRILKRDETALEAARGGQEPEVAARGDILTPAPRTSNRLAHPSYFRE